MKLILKLLSIILLINICVACKKSNNESPVINNYSIFKCYELQKGESTLLPFDIESDTVVWEVRIKAQYQADEYYWWESNDTAFRKGTNSRYLVFKRDGDIFLNNGPCKIILVTHRFKKDANRPNDTGWDTFTKTIQVISFTRSNFLGTWGGYCIEQPDSFIKFNITTAVDNNGPRLYIKTIQKYMDIVPPGIGLTKCDTNYNHSQWHKDFDMLSFVDFESYSYCGSNPLIFICTYKPFMYMSYNHGHPKLKITKYRLGKSTSGHDEIFHDTLNVNLTKLN